MIIEAVEKFNVKSTKTFDWITADPFYAIVKLFRTERQQMVIVKVRKGQLLKSQLFSKTVDTLLDYSNHCEVTVKNGCDGYQANDLSFWL